MLTLRGGVRSEDGHIDGERRRLQHTHGERVRIVLPVRHAAGERQRELIPAPARAAHLAMVGWGGGEAADCSVSVRELVGESGRGGDGLSMMHTQAHAAGRICDDWDEIVARGGVRVRVGVHRRMRNHT